MTRTPWTPEETALLVKSYTDKIKPLSLLPNRSILSIRHKATRIGLKWWQTKDICRMCGVALDATNWYESCKERRDRICIICQIKKSADQKKREPLRTRRWLQENQLHTNGQVYTCRKRPKPELCELCQRKTPKAYHHWTAIIKGQYVAGVWTCHRCHQFAELYDQGYAKKYEELKETIMNESRTNPS